MSIVEVSQDLNDDKFDGLVLLFDRVEALGGLSGGLKERVCSYQAVNSKATEEVSVIDYDKIPSRRLILSPTGPLNRDYDDVRRIYEAAWHGIAKAKKAGCRKPLLAVAPLETLPQKAAWGAQPLLTLNAVLGSFHALYTPLELRELAEFKPAADLLGLFLPAGVAVDGAAVAAVARALEVGREMARDIGGSDPERMAAPRIAAHVQALMGDGVSVFVEEVDEAKFPLMAAVNRAAQGVKRHAGRVIHLTYEGEGPIDTTLMLVGKGITYDTGGADIKAGGVMAGMHRDKCGAAAVAGFFKVLQQLKPKGLRVLGGMACVRNSVGSDCYVSDEIITSRAGVRVRVGNTDAEGRMAMADLLCLMKERALNEGHPNPQIFTWATLTGHVIRAYGEAYTAVMDNGRARELDIARSLQAAGDLISDPFEMSTIRRDDYEFHAGPSVYEDVLQCNNKPSTMTSRGHMTPSAFMIMASGIDKCGLDSATPVCYSHCDVAGSSGPFPGIPTGAPILAFAAKYILPRIGFIR